MKRSVFVCLVCILGSGCTSPGLYDWGGYDSYLYSYYDNPQAAEMFRESLESHISQLESRGQTPPPGLYAELGTLYLESGDTKKAITFYEKEQQAWPESRHLMASLISNLDKKTLEE